MPRRRRVVSKRIFSQRPESKELKASTISGRSGCPRRSDLLAGDEAPFPAVGAM
jgi:hypothetical protein